MFSLKVKRHLRPVEHVSFNQEAFGENATTDPQWNKCWKIKRSRSLVQEVLITEIEEMEAAYPPKKSAWIEHLITLNGTTKSSAKKLSCDNDLNQ